MTHRPETLRAIRGLADPGSDSYRAPLYSHSGEPRPGPVIHFGERVLHGKYGFKLTRENYAIPSKKPSFYWPRKGEISAELWAEHDALFEDAEHTIYSDKFVSEKLEHALLNYDLNIEFFDQIPAEQFDAALDEMLAAHPELEPVHDLKAFDGVAGLYVLVLDGYRQAYIGQASDIRKRIKNHWAGVKQFDRLLWGPTEASVLSIDSFRSLDTTRIYASRTSRRDQLEIELVNSFSPDFLLNRTAGGVPTNGLRALFLLAAAKRRVLVAPTDTDTAHPASIARTDPNTANAPTVNAN